jgi:hypothetical protein
MASETEIVNMALTKNGTSRINSLSDNTEAAKIMRAIYSITLDAVLQAYPWNFAIKRAVLAPDADAPVWGYNYAYTMPADFLSLISIKDDPEYSFEGGKILTNDGPALYMLYISRVTNTGEYSPVFINAFSSKLAAESVEPITQSNSKRATLEALYEKALDEAYMADAQENQLQKLPEDDWVLERL